MDRRLNRADRKLICRLGVWGLVSGLTPVVMAAPPAPWNVVREPVDSVQAAAPGTIRREVTPFITEPVSPALSSYSVQGYAFDAIPERPAVRSIVVVPEKTTQASDVKQPSSPLDLPLLPPASETKTVGNRVEETAVHSQVATPRRIQPKMNPEGTPANLARLPAKDSKQDGEVAALPVAKSGRPSRPVLRDEYDSSIFESTQATAPFAHRPIQPTAVMPGFGAVSLREQAAKHLDASAARLNHQASLSAGAEATQSLRQIAQAKDLAAQTSYTSTQLESALTALKEAEDFVDRYGNVDGTAITRMVRAHQTTVLKAYDCSQLTGTSAADVYLDTSRRILADLASTDPLAAHAIACLAKSYRQRASESRLAMAASVHLMRAAVIAVPNDRELTEELASVLNQAELRTEAQHVLALSQRLTPRQVEPVVGGPIIAVVSGMRIDGVNGQPTQAVRLEQITPEAFSQLSRIESGPSGSLPSYYQSPGQPNSGQQNLVAQGSLAPSNNLAGANAQSMRTSQTTTSVRPDVTGNISEPGVIETQVGNPFTRAVKSVTSKWK